MPNNKAVIDIKPKNSMVLDVKPKVLQAFGETTVYLEERFLPLAMPIPFGGAFHLTYPIAGTISGPRT